MPTRVERATNRLVNPLFLKVAGRRLRSYSVLRHVGRRSGREYANPVTAYPLGDGFVVALLYGRDSQWVRNVLATGRCTLRTMGRDHALERPEFIPAGMALAAYPRHWTWLLRRRGIGDFLWLHAAGGRT